MIEISSPAALKILDEAEACFTEWGYEGTSIQMVARRAGVSKANVFHHFGSKENLYLTVLRRACGRLSAVLDTLPSADPFQRMAAFVRAHLQALLANPRPARLIQRAMLEAGDGRGRQLAEQVFAATFERVVALVREAQDQGQVRAGLDPGLVAFSLIGAGAFFFETLPVLRHLPGAEFATDPENYSCEVFRLLKKGIR